MVYIYALKSPRGVRSAVCKITHLKPQSNITLQSTALNRVALHCDALLICSVVPSFHFTTLHQTVHYTALDSLLQYITSHNTAIIATAQHTNMVPHYTLIQDCTKYNTALIYTELHGTECISKHCSSLNRTEIHQTVINLHQVHCDI